MKAQQQQNLTLIAAKWQARLSAAQAALANLQDFIAQNLLAPRVDGGHLYELESAVYAKLEALLLFMDGAESERLYELLTGRGSMYHVLKRDIAGGALDWDPARISVELEALAGHDPAAAGELRALLSAGRTGGQLQ